MKLFQNKATIPVINKAVYLSTVIIAILALISIISIGFFTWPKADDFSRLNEINKLGIVPHVINRYNSWDGRAISVGFIQALFLKYLPVEIINVIWSSCLILTAFISLKIFLYLSKINKKIKTLDYFIGAAIFSSVLWYGFKPHLSDTVYWAIGGIYIMALLFAVIWLYLWFTKFSFQQNIRPLHKVLFSLFTVYVGALTQNLSCALLAYMGIEMIKAVLEKDAIIIKRTILVILLLITGLLIVVVAPGNFIRSTYGLQSFNMNLPVIVTNYFKTSAHFTILSLILFVLLFISIPIIVIFSIYSTHQKLKKRITISLKRKYSISLDVITIKQIVVTILSRFQFFLAAFFSALPFALVPDFNSPRTSIYFMAFMLFWTYFEIIPFILKHIMRQTIYETKPPSYRPYVLITIFLLGTLSIVITHIINLNRIKKDVLKRENIIKTYSNKNVDVVIYPIDQTKIPFSYRFSDIASDKDNWINQAVAAMYRLKSIRAHDSSEQ